MLPSETLLSLIFIALSAVDATPLTRRTGKATLSIATNINEHYTQNIAEMDRTRAQAMKQITQPGKRSTSPSVADSVVFYTVQVGVGEPATTCT